MGKQNIMKDNITGAKQHQAQMEQANRELQEARQAALNMMEDALQAKEQLELTQFALDHAVDEVFWIRPDGSFAYVNEAACNNLGYSKEDLLRLSVKDIDPDFPFEQWPQHWAELKEKKSLVFETGHRTRDGKRFPVEIHARYLKFDDQEFNCAFAHDITERKESEARLKQIEWMLSAKPASNAAAQNKEIDQGYGDLTELNRDGMILKSIGREQLKRFTNDYLDLMGTSSAVYEVNGDYAFGIFSSGWCRMMDCASRQLCDMPDNVEALNSGCWLCHESCWTDCCKRVITEGVPMDIACNGGIRMYAAPILTNGTVVGAINFGYGDPPKEPETLRKLAEDYHLDYEDLVHEAHAYDSRPPFIIELAKQRLHATARLIGSMIETKQMEEDLRSEKNRAEENEMRFKALHNASFGGIVIHDKGLILDCNQGLSDITGYPQEELVGMDGLLLIAEQFRQWVMDHILAGDETPYEAVGVCKDGREYPLRLEGRQIPYQGKQVRVVEFRDITEQKKAERRFQEQLKELTRWYEAMLGRENRVLELKEEVNELLKKSGQPPRYATATETGNF
jgi:PAS domain S-box-containing protein